MQQAKQKAEAAAAVRDRQKRFVFWALELEIQISDLLSQLDIISTGRAVEQGAAGEEEVDEDGKVVRDASKSAMGLLEHDPKVTSSSGQKNYRITK